MEKTLRLSENSLRKLVKRIIQENVSELDIARALDPSNRFEHQLDADGNHYIHLPSGYVIQVFVGTEEYSLSDESPSQVGEHISIQVREPDGGSVDGDPVDMASFDSDDAQGAISYGKKMISQWSRA